MALPTLEPLKSERLNIAVRVLSKLTVPDLAEAIAHRVAGEIEYRGLPPLSRDEYPADIFVDYVHYCERANRPHPANAMREAVADVLSRATAKRLQAGPLTEAAYLAGRIGSKESIVGLASLAEEPEAYEEIGPNGERATNLFLRTLLGLLGHFKNAIDIGPYSDVFRGNLSRPGCQFIALAGMAATSPAELQKSLAEMRKMGKQVSASDLDIALETAGFDPVHA